MIVLEQVRAGYQSRQRLMSKISSETAVLHDIDLVIEAGSIVGIIGESGSGKTTLARLLCGLIKPLKGQVTYQDSFYEHKGKKRSQKLKKGSMAIVFQDYLSSVNPKMKIEAILRESQNLRKVNDQVFNEELKEILTFLDINPVVLQRYPHEVSGGQLQRICIARAVLLRPQIIIFDEVTSALDSVTQIQILDLIKKIHRTYKVTCVLITHDVLAATYCCQQLIIMHLGRIVDQVKDLTKLGEVQHDYSQKLLGAVGSLEAFSHD